MNIYAEEMTDRVEIVEKVIDGVTFTGLRLYLYLPVTTLKSDGTPWVPYEQLQGPFIHGKGDDDSSAITFWGKKSMREVLVKALEMLDHHYKEREGKW